MTTNDYNNSDNIIRSNYKHYFPYFSFCQKKCFFLPSNYRYQFVSKKFLGCSKN